MNIFGIGPLELLFIFLIALILLGPTDMVSTSRKLGSLLRKFFTSSTWRSMKKIRDLPAQLMRDAGIDDLNIGDLGLEQIKKDIEIEKIDSEIKKSLPKKEDLTVDLDSATESKSSQKNKIDITSWVTKPEEKSLIVEQEAHSETELQNTGKGTSEDAPDKDIE